MVIDWVSVQILDFLICNSILRHRSLLVVLVTTHVSQASLRRYCLLSDPATRAPFNSYPRHQRTRPSH